MLLIKEINMQRGHNKATKRVLEAQVTYDCLLDVRLLAMLKLMMYSREARRGNSSDNILPI